MGPLPDTGAGGQEGLHGFLAPFNASVYGTRYAEGADMAYTCGVNFCWQNSVMSPMPWVPLHKQRAMDMVKDLNPGLLEHNCASIDSFGKGKDLPKGGCARLSPDEVVHGVVFKVAARIIAGASAAERKQWLRTLLSVPCVFKRLGGSEGAQYAEANSLRQDIMGTSRSVTHTARQLIYNVHGFKAKQEKGGKTLGAKATAKLLGRACPRADGSGAHEESSAPLTHASPFTTACSPSLNARTWCGISRSCMAPTARAIRSGPCRSLSSVAAPMPKWYGAWSTFRTAESGQA